MERRAVLLLAGLLLSAPPGVDRRLGAVPQLPADAEVHVYLEPLQPEAERLTFSVGTVTAVNEQGAGVPLQLALTTIGGTDNRRQRLLASGRVPAGSYARLSLIVQKASVRRDAGSAALLVAGTPIDVSAPFVLPRRGAVVLWLSVVGGGIAAGDTTFAPVLAARVAPRPIVGRAGFVSSPQANTITMFDRRLREAAVVIPTGAGPAGLALDQPRGRLYVACTREEEIQVVDAATAEVVERVRLVPGDGPRELGLTPDGRTLLSTNTNSNTVGVFDTSPLTRLDRISVGSGPGALVIDPTGRRAFVFNALSNSISVIDIAARRVAATLSTDASPVRGKFNGRGDRLYVIHERSPFLTVVDPSQLNVVTRARLRIGLGAIEVDTRRGLLYTAGRDDPGIEFYDPNTLLPVGALKTRGGIVHLAIDVGENALYMVSPDTRSVVVGDLADRKVMAEIDVAQAPAWVSVMGER